MQDAVVVKVETSFDHVWLLRDQVDKIMAATGAGIRCPDVSFFEELPKKYCVWIRGSLDQVYKASTMFSQSFDTDLKHILKVNIENGYLCLCIYSIAFFYMLGVDGTGYHCASQSHEMPDCNC